MVITHCSVEKNEDYAWRQNLASTCLPFSDCLTPSKILMCIWTAPWKMHLVAPDGCPKKNQGNKHQITYIFTFAKGLLYLRQNMKIGTLPFLQLFFKTPTFPLSRNIWVLAFLRNTSLDAKGGEPMRTIDRPTLQRWCLWGQLSYSYPTCPT